MTFDTKLACAALVLSDALASFSLNPNDRWELAFIDEFTEAEARQYLNNRDCLVHNATARAILLKPTTLGLDLHKFVQSNQSVEQFTQDLMGQAGGVVGCLVHHDSVRAKLAGLAFEMLVCMLLDDQHKDGVAVELTWEFAERPFIIRCCDVATGSLRRQRILLLFSRSILRCRITCRLEHTASKLAPRARRRCR
jgi:hypothetical protein